MRIQKLLIKLTKLKTKYSRTKLICNKNYYNLFMKCFLSYIAEKFEEYSSYMINQ